MTDDRMTTVVTWQSPAGATYSLCPRHDAQRAAAHDWPRDAEGQEYCSVSHGVHRGYCDDCEEEDPAAVCCTYPRTGRCVCDACAEIDD